MRRAALEHPRLLARRRLWRALRHDTPGAPPAANRFRKTLRASGCGHAHCWLCHGDKLAGAPTLRERRARLNHAEGLGALGRYAR